MFEEYVGLGLDHVKGEVRLGLVMFWLHEEYAKLSLGHV